MNKRRLMVGYFVILCFLSSGCAAIQKRSEHRLKRDYFIYYCDTCKRYFAFKKPSPDYEYSVGYLSFKEQFGEVKHSEKCPVCGKEMVIKSPEKGAKVTKIITFEFEEEKREHWICGRAFIGKYGWSK